MSHIDRTFVTRLRPYQQAKLHPCPIVPHYVSDGTIFVTPPCTMEWEAKDPTYVRIYDIMSDLVTGLHPHNPNVHPHVSWMEVHIHTYVSMRLYKSTY